jgi:hypothetical protein
MNAFHRSEINNDAVIAQTKPRHVMTGTQNGRCKLVLACELYTLHHVGHTGTACDDRGMAVNHSIVDLARFFITLFAWTKHLAPQRSSEILNH